VGGLPATPAEVEARPLIERIGLGLIAIIVVAVFTAIAWAALAGGEIFLGVMAGIGALMTLWAAVTSLRRG
jgi:hypothetical protein